MFNIFKLYYFFPIFLVTGPFLPDLIVSLSSILFLIHFIRNEKYYLTLNYFYIFLFIYIIFLISSLVSENIFFSLKSSLPYLRIIIFPLIVFFLLEKKIINLNLSLKILMLTTLILSLDGIFQFIFGFNIFGMNSPLNYRVTGFFGDEAILGSFLSKIIPLIFTTYFFLGEGKNKYMSFYFYITILIGLICIFISGDRMPMGTIFLYLILLNLLLFSFKKFIFLLIIMTLVIILLFTNNTLKNRYINMTVLQLFEKNISANNLNKPYVDQDNVKENLNINYANVFNSKILFFSKSHTEHFKSAYSIFKKNKLIGSGPNTFRLNCQPKFYEHKHKCSSHPHNIYFQLLSEVGIIGFLILSSFLFYFIYKLFLNVKIKNELNLYIYIHLFISIFPIATYGNFFNNYSSIILFYPIGFYIYMLNRKKLNI